MIRISNENYHIFISRNCFDRFSSFTVILTVILFENLNIFTVFIFILQLLFIFYFLSFCHIYHYKLSQLLKLKKLKLQLGFTNSIQPSDWCGWKLQFWIPFACNLIAIAIDRFAARSYVSPLLVLCSENWSHQGKKMQRSDRL